MCDPVSATASVLAVAGFAAHSCEYLYKTFKSLSDAPEEVQRHIASLHALQLTLVDIGMLEKDVSDPALFTQEFKSRLQECLLDLQAMERQAKPFQQDFEDRTARRTFARIRWSSIDHKYKLKKFLSRIEAHYTCLSLGLSLLHM